MLRLWTARRRCRIDVVHHVPARVAGLLLTGALLCGCSGPGPAQQLAPPQESGRTASPDKSFDDRGTAPTHTAPTHTAPTPGPQPAWTPPAETDLADRAQYAAALEDGVNAARTQLGARPLQHDPCLEAVAEDRAAALIGAAELVHAPLPPVQRRCPGGTVAAENLSRTDRPPQDVVQAWLDSPSHRDNLVSVDLVRSAIGCVRDGGTDAEPVLVCSHVFIG
ncbi:putative conserved protein YkwD, contains CAP (CSP/antigen 5/PR1) domain [Promicromonospora thailandica]|uniref:Conserved protein YkwD, contains CAP (CSP/antigen 5/PR1) domain n=1 Tax=Promicromonospora thailandica TaxID=765201 RepID=A0A9X2G3K3_9MICO|nr:putative conserved protein YkwD, contains CAP (CSP/antigen 5/PR1) domain [Promicromonospora thailandica]